MKPPNILIKSACAEKFRRQENIINSLVKPDRYTIYHIDEEKFNKQPWSEACMLLIFEYNGSSSLKEDDLKMFSSYIHNHDGRILFHGDAKCPDISSMMDNLSLISNVSDTSENDFVTELGKSFESNFQVHASLLKRNLFDVPHDQLQDILKKLCIEVGGERQNITMLPGYLYVEDSHLKYNQIFKLKASNPDIVHGNNLRICFSEESFVDEQNELTSQADEPNCTIINVLSKPPYSSTFDWELYKNILKTKQYGKAVIFKNVIESTHDVFTKLPVGTIIADGLVVTAAQQTKGRGRGGNKWLSPLGCMMFSMQINISPKSLLGQRISCIQHLVVVAFVKAIKERKGYEDLHLSIKWPNDIYIKGDTKVGGVIVNSSFFNDNFSIIIGLGVNISNESPTDCVNSLIRDHNLKYGSTLEEISIEDALASTVNNLEYLVELFNEKGVDRFKEEYFSFWMHGGTKVTLEFEDNAKATITGLDDFGYLEVQLDDGRKLCLQPDGNSFDMMRNMISLKS